MASLYESYAALFLRGNGIVSSSCGHEVFIFDHHFFHLAAVRTASGARLYMPEEIEEIKACTKDYGKYILDHSGSRARNLPSAHATICEPDEVWSDDPKTTTAEWVYVRQFDSKPYPFTVALLVTRPEESGIIVPVSSFPCSKSDVRKWRQGKLVYQKQIQPPEGG